MAELLHVAIQQQQTWEAPQLLCPVPLGPARLAERGFNQALEIARPLARLLDVPLQPRLALRVRDTRAQSSVAPQERRANLAHAFAIAPEHGALLQGCHVGIVDDVMSAGTAARESIALIQAAGATPHAVAIALDRQEMATENGQDVAHSAVQYVRQQLGLQVCAIATLADLLAYLGQQADGEATMAEHYQRVTAYRQRYGVAG